MGNLSKIGRIFFGIAVAEIGIQAIYCRDFPYILSLPQHFWKPGAAALAVIFGILFLLAGLSIVFERRTRAACLLFACLLLIIFGFYYIPYELFASVNYMHVADWENSAKELAFAGGALAIARCFPEDNKHALTRSLARLIPFGAAIFAITIVFFGVLHFVYARQAADYVPAWIPYHLFWMYFCGAALLAAGIAIILKKQTRLAAALLGAMIFTWFIILHMPRVIATAAAGMPGELTSAMLALAYCGSAFVIAGNAKK